MTEIVIINNIFINFISLMKKNKLFLSVATLLLAGSAVSYASMLGMGAVTASSPEVSEVEEVAELNEIAQVAEVAEPKIEDYKVTELDYTGNTQYLLYNVEAKGYFVGTNSWGTRASYTTTLSAGYKVTISAGQGEGLYSLNDYCLAKGGGLYAVDCQGVDNIWTDGTGRAGAGMWQFTAQPDGTFLISNTNVKAAEGEKTLYLSVVPGSSENNEVIAGTSLYMSNAENAQNRWAFVSVDYLTDLEAYEKANYKAGDEVTSLAPGTWIAAQGNGPNPYSTGTETFGNPSFSAGKVLYQSIEGLKNGEYEVTLYAAANLAAWNGQTGSGAGIAQVYANTTTYDVEVIDQKDCTLSNYEYTLKATVTDGTLEYGLQNIATGGCWYVCQLVKIKYVGEAVDLSVYVSELTNAVAAAEAVNGNMNSTVKAALDKAISDNKTATYTTADDYSAAIKSVKDATANAKASVAVYELAAEYTGKADGLDKTGKAIYAADVTVAAVAAAYNDGTLDAITDEQKSAMDAALVAAVKAQTTDGADMTLAIVNPTIINNGQNTDCPYGWTESTHTGWSWTKATGDTFFENWNGSASQVNFDFKQTITGLPNGTYKVTANMFASTNGEEGAEFSGKGYVLYGLASNEAQVSVDENNYDDPPTVFKAYTTGEVKVTDGTLTIGVKTVGTPTERWFGADNFKLTMVSCDAAVQDDPELAAAKEAAIATVDALPVGDGLFYYSQANIDAAKAAINAAKTEEEVKAVTVAANAPVEGKAYEIANTTAEGNLSVANSAVTIANGAKVYFTAVEGGYAISSENGEYIFKTSDGWTLSTTTEISEAYVLNVNIVEGGYTISGNKGLLGTDSRSEGAVVYADKAAGNNGVWTIKEAVNIEDLSLEKVKELAIASLDLLPVGDALFYYSQANIDAVKGAIEAAENVDEVKAISAPSCNMPTEGQAYLVANTTADGNLSIADGAVTIAKDAKVFFTAVDGGFVISNADYEYVAQNNAQEYWMFTTTNNVEEAYVVSVNPVEGGYTIKGARGLFGTDDVATGAVVYSDKSADKNGVWTITESVEEPDPEPVPEGDLVVLHYEGKSSGNMTDGNNAELVSLNPETWTVTATKGYASAMPGVNADGSIRLYFNSAGSNSITVTNNVKKINSIKIEFVDESYSEAAVSVDGKVVAGVDGVYEIKSNSFTVTNASESRMQVRIKSISIYIEKDVDAISTVADDATVGTVKKVVRNGRIVLVKGGKTYNVNGALLSE